jgi:hypothetical protein
VNRLGARAAREIYRRELLPARMRWWLTARGMCDWYRVVAKELGPHFDGDGKAIVAELAAHALERRYRALRESHAFLPDPERDPRALAIVMSALYRLDRTPRARWILDGVGGAARGFAERARGELYLKRIRPEDRWRETTVHLGEWLIVLTEELPAKLPRARAIVADICFRAGVRFAEHARDELGVDGDGPDAAIEVLRMTEYLFRVNPEHWSETAGDSGYLEGTACPWYSRPGWERGHCGIFGQFQAGISSVYGLRYELTKTIPKHGGHTCRIDLKPIGLRRSRDDAETLV